MAAKDGAFHVGSTSEIVYKALYVDGDLEMRKLLLDLDIGIIPRRSFEYDIDIDISLTKECSTKKCQHHKENYS